MERPRRGLVLPLLLLGLLAGAAASIGADAQPPCDEPTALATRTQVALVCASGLPTPPCCETVVAAVDRGGGVPCLFRAAAQPEAIVAGVSAARLISLYVACGGHTEPTRFTGAACLGTNCNWTLLAFELTEYCNDVPGVPNRRCCKSVLTTIDSEDPNCLCRVSEAGDMVVSPFLGVSVMWHFYQACGGRKQAIPKDKEMCSHVPSPPPSSSPPPPPSPVPEADQLPPWEIAVIAVSVVSAVVVVVALGILIWKKVKERARQERQRELELQEQARQRELELQEARQRAVERADAEARQQARADAEARQEAVEQAQAEARQRVIERARSLEQQQRVRVRAHYSLDTSGEAMLN